MNYNNLIMKKLSGFLFFCFLVLLFSAGPAKADEPVTVHLEIETASSTIFNDNISVSACPETLGSATTTVNGFCALEQSGLSISANWLWAPSVFITSIGGASEDAATYTYWLWFSDLNLSNDAINQHLLTAGEHILFTLGTYPLKISAADLSPFDGATTTISVTQFDPAAFNWIPAQNATVDYGGATTTTDVNGQADITAASLAPFSVSASKENFLSSDVLNITPRQASANITIRNGTTVVFSGAVALPASNAAAVDILPTNASSTVAVPARSLLSVLKTLDAAQSEFAISDLQYYSSLNSFFINCLTVSSEADPLCGSWQYNLNGVNPSFGVDQALLKNGDVVFLYFGSPRQVSLSAATATTGISFTATAQKYEPENNVYVATTGVTVGVTQPNPNDPWNPMEIATSTVNADGQAIFTLNTAGTYKIGIKEDYYFPVTTLTVTDPVSSPGGSVIIPPASGGGSSVTPAAKVDLNKAVDFLTNKQAADGSFGSVLQTDWAAMALASFNPNSQAGQKIRSYLLTDPNPLVGMNPVSDYARRAMALMSLNINPYNGVGTNYIKKIIDLYDGAQFGDAALFNDDIFALLVLNKAGYGAADEIIKQTVGFVLSKQQADGSWGGADLTAAAVQALSPLSSIDGISPAISKARNFLFNAQGADGGFGNSYATAWVMQAISVLSENSGNWQKNGQTPESFLAISQGADGGLDKDNSFEINRVWATAYAIPAIQNKPWPAILNNFAKEVPATSQTTPTNNPGAMENIIATSTSSWQATSTLSELFDFATSSAKALEPEVLGEKVAASPAGTEKIAEEALSLIEAPAPDFVIDGTDSTAKLGAGERAGVINSYKSAFDKLPESQADWEDIIRISNNQMPLITNPAAEDRAKKEFKKVYQREADIKNLSDQTAINFMAYGLRPDGRDLDSERAGLRVFVGIYKYLPASALDWDIIRAIAYSGVSL